MIRLSLYVQQRAVRGTDVGSQKNITFSKEFDDNFITFPYETDSFDQQIMNQYRISQRHIYDWYCHAAARAVETESVDINSVHKTTVPELSTPEGYEITSIDEVVEFAESVLNEVELPTVLHVLTDGSKNIHSAIVLGKDETGTYILWEKKGFSFPYKLTSLQQIYHDYSFHNQEWLVRPLQSNEEV